MRPATRRGMQGQGPFSGIAQPPSPGSGPPLIHPPPPHPTCACPADQGHGFMPSYVYRQCNEFYHRQVRALSLFKAAEHECCCSRRARVLSCIKAIQRKQHKVEGVGGARRCSCLQVPPFRCTTCLRFSDLRRPRSWPRGPPARFPTPCLPPPSPAPRRDAFTLAAPLAAAAPHAGLYFGQAPAGPAHWLRSKHLGRDHSLPAAGGAYWRRPCAAVLLRFVPALASVDLPFLRACM